MVKEIQGKCLDHLPPDCANAAPELRDYALAIIWTHIMWARHSCLRFATKDEALLIIHIPGAFHIHQSSGPPLKDFGNSTVTTVARTGSYDMDSMIYSAYPFIQDYAMAAVKIRTAIKEITFKYITGLLTLNTVEPRPKVQRALRKASQVHPCVLTFEDWFGLGDGVELKVPRTQGGRPIFLPSPGHMQEGSIIMLPPQQLELQSWQNDDTGQGTDDSNREQWSFCICLQGDEMVALMDHLRMEGLAPPMPRQSMLDLISQTMFYL